MSSTPGSSPSGRNKKKNLNSPMTRAVVANLNRQRGESNGQTPQNGNNGHSNIGNSSQQTLPQKSLPPEPSKQGPMKQLPDVPEFYVVRPAPSNAKIERNDQRVFINRTTMEKIKIAQGTVVLIQRHDPDKWIPQVDTLDDTSSYYPSDQEEQDSEQATVGVVWPMDRIEPNGSLPCTGTDL